MAIGADNTTPTPDASAPDWPTARQRDDRTGRQICVRIDAERYAMLEEMAMRHGVAPTTMARMLVHRGLREEELAWE
jgi:hypothetical protein